MLLCGALSPLHYLKSSRLWYYDDQILPGVAPRRPRYFAYLHTCGMIWAV